MIKSYYVLRRPGKEKGRKATSFSLYKRTTFPDGRKASHKLESPQLDAVNRAYKAGTHDFEYCNQRAGEILDQLYRDDGKKVIVPHSTENMGLVNKYWSEVYGVDGEKEVVDPESEYNALVRAILTIGMLPILTTEKKELERAIWTATEKNPKVYNRRIQKINQILKYYKVDLNLRKKPEQFKTPTSLTLEEFEKVVEFETDPTFKMLDWIGFTTGERIGEIFEVGATNVVDFEMGTIFVTNQYTYEGEVRITKNRKDRKLSFFSEGDEWIRKWLEIPLETRRGYRKLANTAAARLYQCCVKAFPKSPEKWITFHDLRHSYAKRLFDSPGMSLDLVADMIGDDPRTARKYYLGWIRSSEALALVSKVTRQKKD